MGLERFRSRACRFRTNGTGANSGGRMLCAPTAFRWTVGAAISRPQAFPLQGGRWHGEAVTDEGGFLKRGPHLGGSPKGLPCANSKPCVPFVGEGLAPPAVLRKRSSFCCRGDPRGRPVPGVCPSGTYAIGAHSVRPRAGLGPAPTRRMGPFLYLRRGGCPHPPEPSPLEKGRFPLSGGNG